MPPTPIWADDFIRAEASYPESGPIRCGLYGRGGRAEAISPRNVNAEPRDPPRLLLRYFSYATNQRTT
jgi:hypothetical protein